MRESKFKMPNSLILNTDLSYTARIVGATLYAHRNALGFCRKYSVEQLGKLSGIGEKSVRNAIPQLIEAGYIQVGRSHLYHKAKKRIVYGKNVYTCNLQFVGGYTLIPRHVLNNRDITPAAMCVYFYLFHTAGNECRAYPKLTEIEKGVGAAHSTVCRVLKQLQALPGILIQHCINVCNKFAQNSYRLLSLRHYVAHQAAASMPTEENQPKKRATGILHRAILNLSRLCRAAFKSLVVRFLPSIS